MDTKSGVLESLNREYFGTNFHEKNIIKNLPSILSSVNVFVDIGASLGQYTFYINKHIRGGKIFAVEADPFRFATLKDNCNKWESFSNNKLYPIHAAISDLDGNVPFYITNSSVSGGLFIHSIPYESGEEKKTIKWEEIIVRSLKLDTLIKNTNADLIKIDVEGGELRVLRGATKLLQEGETKFLIEIHSWADPKGQSNCTDVYDFMKSFCYYPINFYGHKLFVKKR